MIATVLSATWWAPQRTGDLQLFVDAARAMMGDEGLRVYAERPEIQSGPLALAAIWALDGAGDRMFPVAVGGLFVVAFAAVLAMTEPGRRRVVVLGLGGAVALFWWRTYAFQGHLDDAAVIAIAMWALVAVRRDRRLAAAVMLGVSLAIKPWAVFLLPMTLCGPGSLWRRSMAPMVSLGIGAAIWAPFLLSSAGTMAGAKPTVWMAPDSVWRLISGTASTMPTGLRLAQLAICFGAVTWLALRGHVAAAPLVGIALRLLLDGGTWPYYTAGFVMAAFAWDMVESRSRLPWATIAATVLLPKPSWFGPDELRALLRTIACLGAVVAVMWTVRRGTVDLAGTDEIDVDVDDGSGAARPAEGGRRAEGITAEFV
jgi:hypothetical protein